MALVRVYCGLASADPADRPASSGPTTLTSAVVDDAGRLLQVCEISDDPTGYALLGAFLVERVSGPNGAMIAADSDDHLVTSLLSAAGRPLAIADDDLVDDFAEQFADDDSMAEIQSAPAQRRAVGLARALQAGALSAVTLPAPRDLATFKPVLAAHAALANGRHSAAVALRELLREIYPAALRAYPDPAEPLTLAVLNALPEPGMLLGTTPGSQAPDAVIEQLVTDGVAEVDRITEAITALRVAIDETPRRGTVQPVPAPAVAEAVRQAVAAVRACDNGCAALIATLANRTSLPSPVSGRRTLPRSGTAARTVPPAVEPGARTTRPEPVTRATGRPEPAQRPTTGQPAARATRPEPVTAPLAPRPEPAQRPNAAQPAAHVAERPAPGQRPGDPQPSTQHRPEPSVRPAAARTEPAPLPGRRNRQPVNGMLATPQPLAPPPVAPAPVTPPPAAPPPLSPAATPAGRLAEGEPAGARSAASGHLGQAGDRSVGGGRQEQPAMHGGNGPEHLAAAAARRDDADERPAPPPGMTLITPGARPKIPPAEAGEPFRATLTTAAINSARAERQRATTVNPRGRDDSEGAGPSQGFGATDLPVPLPAPRPEPDRAPPGSRANWPLVGPSDSDEAIVGPSYGPDGRGAPAEQPEPVNRDTGSLDTGSRRVTPPWQADDLPPEPPVLRLVEPPAPLPVRTRSDDAVAGLRADAGTARNGAGRPGEREARTERRGGPEREAPEPYRGLGDGSLDGPPLRLVEAEEKLARNTPRSERRPGEPISAPPVADEGDGDLLIFAATRSAWFTGQAEESDAEWSSTADSGWRAAEQAARPAVGAKTGAGLPRRVPQANLVPGSPLRDERPLRIVRDPARMAEHTTGYFRGWRRGQEIGGFAVGGRPGRESAGGWDFSRDHDDSDLNQDYEYRPAGYRSRA